PRLRRETPLPERVATADLFHEVARQAETSGATFYLLGGSRPVIEQAVQNVRRLYPRLAIVGFRHGYLRRSDDEAAIIAELNAARPDILWIGMGVPLEQAFSMRVAPRLTNVGVIRPSGGLFDVL